MATRYRCRGQAMTWVAVVDTIMALDFQGRDQMDEEQPVGEFVQYNCEIYMLIPHKFLNRNMTVKNNFNNSKYKCSNVFLE
jgi:hypothetical protein